MSLLIMAWGLILFLPSAPSITDQLNIVPH